MRANHYSLRYGIFAAGRFLFIIRANAASSAISLLEEIILNIDAPRTTEYHAHHISPLFAYAFRHISNISVRRVVSRA